MGLCTKQRVLVLVLAALLGLTVIGRLSYSRHLHGLVCAARTYHKIAIGDVSGNSVTEVSGDAAPVALEDRPKVGAEVVETIRKHQLRMRVEREKEMEFARQTGQYDRRLVKKERQQKKQMKDSDRVKPAGQQVLPQALIIGVRKCGTRALLEMLEMHTQVVASGPEVHFFDRQYERGLDWYRQQMPASLPGQLTMEKTPSYYITPEAPKRIHAMSPNTKLLVIVRNPTTRVISDYTQIAGKDPSRFSAEDFTKTVLDKEGQVRKSYKAVQVSIYADFLQDWLKFFPLNQLHFVDGDRVVADPFPEIKKVEAFLNISDFITADKFRYNPDSGFYCLTGELNKKCLSSSKGRQHPNVTADVITKLQDFYRPHNERFFKMLGQRFDWP